MFLSDLTRIEEGNETFVEQEQNPQKGDQTTVNVSPTTNTLDYEANQEQAKPQLINLPKFKLMYSVAYNLLLHQKAPKKLEQEEPLHSLLYELPCLNEDELLDLSTQLLPSQ